MLQAIAKGTFLFIVVFAVTTCTQDVMETEAVEEGLVEGEAVTAFESTALETYNSGFVEIDRVDPHSTTFVGDANLLEDNTAATEVPACSGTCDYIDWDTLCTDDITNHRLLDDFKLDHSSFPLSNHCVGTSNVLSKMDITYVMASNNSEYAYFAVQRRNNNGDAAYYWLFTRLEPILDPADPDCKSGDKGLRYDITEGDVLLRGSFSPSGGVALHVYTAVPVSAPNLTAIEAIEYTNPALWDEVIHPDVVGAVNTSSTHPLSCGATGVDKQAMDGFLLEPELFAEAAVPIEVFQSNGGDLCSLTFWGSVITRPSGSGGTSPDMKDLAGPQLFKFGEISAAGALTPSCDEKFGFDVTSVTGFGGVPIPIGEVTCAWEFKQGVSVIGTSTECTGGEFDPSPTGTIDASVEITVELPGGGTCSTTVENLSVEVYDGIVVTADATPFCNMTFNYLGSVSGGSPSLTYAWAFTGPDTTTPSSATNLSGTVSVASAGPAKTYTATLSATDDRGFDICLGQASDTAIPLAPLTISLAPAATPASCVSPIDESMTTDAVTYNSSAGGGSGSYIYEWLSPTSCGAAATCTFNPDDDDFCVEQTFQVKLTDQGGTGLPICDPATSETETYTKVTTTTASNN